MDSLTPLANLTVLDGDGAAHTLESLWREGPLLVVFVRQFG